MSGVLQIITTLQRGGAQKIALQAACKLHTQTTPHALISGCEGSLQHEAKHRLGPRHVTVPSLKRHISPASDWTTIQHLRKLIRGFMKRVSPPIVVHTHSSKAGVLGRLATSGLRGVANVHTVHGFGMGSQGPMWEKPFLSLERLASQPKQTLVFVSSADLALSESLHIGHGNRKLLIRAGIDPHRFSQSHMPDRHLARSTFGISPESDVAVVIGNLKPQKDPLFHVEVLNAWRQRNAAAHLLFVGDGPLRHEMVQRAKHLGVDRHLTLPGQLEDVRPALAAADVCLLASLWEGLPCSLLEAMAAGLPIVYRDTGYGKDLSFAGHRLSSQLLSAAPERFAEALEDALSKKRVAVDLPPPFTEEGMLAELEHLYEQCLFEAKIES